VGSPSYPSSPGDQAGPAQPSTAEIPVVRPAAAPVTKQLPPHPGATAFGAQPTTAVQPQPPVPQAPAQTNPPQPTGPVDYVPGLRGAPAPPPPAVAPAGATAVQSWPETLEADGSAPKRGGRALRLPRDRRALVPIGLAALALVLLLLGLSLELGSDSSWESAPLWSAFATAACVVGLLGLAVAATKRGQAGAELAWRTGAAGLVGLSVFWLLVVLPVADGDRGFLLTAALGCLGAALWMAAERD
jgi:hypothetical protein